MSPRAGESDDQTPIDLATALRALVALAVAQRDDPQVPTEQRRKTEIILRDVGCTPQQIAAVTGKSYAAVAKTIQRARKDAS